MEKDVSSYSKGLIQFVVFSFVFSWAFWLADWVIITYSPDFKQLGSLFERVGVFGPSIAGVFFTWKFNPCANRKQKESIGDFLKRGIQWRFHIKWHIFILFTMPLVTLTATLIATGLGADWAGFSSQLVKKPLLIPVFFIVILLVMGPLGEEYGWRGFALERLLIRYNLFIASGILGIIWALWHVPLFMLPNSTQSGINFGIYTLYTVCVSLIISLVYIKTGRSIYAAIVMHTMANLAHALFPALFHPLGIVGLTVSLGVFIILLCVLFRRDFFKRVV